MQRCIEAAVTSEERIEIIEHMKRSKLVPFLFIYSYCSRGTPSTLPSTAMAARDHRTAPDCEENTRLVIAGPVAQAIINFIREGLAWTTLPTDMKVSLVIGQARKTPADAPVLAL